MTKIRSRRCAAGSAQSTRPSHAASCMAKAAAPRAGLTAAWTKPLRVLASPLGEHVATSRVVHVGGRYLAGREQRLWAGLVGIMLAPLVLAATANTGLALVFGVGAVLLAPELVRRLRNTRNGRLGERIVTDALRRLPDDYCLVNDVVLRRARGNIDHILIGPCGVVAIETKRLAGHIRCDGDTWWAKGRRRDSISKQVNAGATAIRSLLIERHPELRDSAALRWVES